MPMEMFRILIFPQICNHATGPMLTYHAGGNLPNHRKQLEQKLAILITEREQRLNMMFGNHHNMYGVKGRVWWKASTFSVSKTLCTRVRPLRTSSQ